MHRLVLDTNQIVEKDWRLRSAAMRLVEKAVAVHLVSLVIPELVIEEAQNKFRQRLEAHVKSAQDATGKIARLIKSEGAVSVPEIGEECKKYSKELNERLTELKAERPRYTKIEHTWLISKALGPRRPFREGDRGYRDALVWHSVLHEVASIDHQTYFVSENKNDFGNNEGELHADLVADLSEAGLDGRVTHMHDLQTFVEKVIKPALEEVPTPVTDEEFEELFEARLDSIISQLREGIDNQGLPGLSDELFLSGAYIYQLGLVSAEARDAYKLDDTSYYTSFDVLVEATFDQTVYAPDAVWLAETLHVNGATSGDEKTTELDFTLTIPLTITVITSTEQGMEPEISIELTEFYGFCRHCRHPILSDAAEQCSECGRSLFQV